MTHRCMVFFYIFLLMLSVSSCTKEKPVTQKTSVQSSESSEAPATAPTEAAEGAKIFAQNCQVCHGEGGKGDICPDLTDRKWKYGNSDEQLFQTISKGRPGGMPNWGNKLSDKQIRDLIAYIRSIGEK
jgi:cytochrome c oxidase cbb3-type subunit 3